MIVLCCSVRYCPQAEIAVVVHTLEPKNYSALCVALVQRAL